MMFLVGVWLEGREEKKNCWDLSVLSPDPPKYFLLKFERKCLDKKPPSTC